ncbi:hypothetical protein ABMA27_014057 [Loxostege sticticalis]|uniref:PiggyBac transposable element-derived protein domain-containing protein n=1 Tax=Loxostege sticticalis TaxID=481309 RepID=A0ABR3ICI1_LOXSC
MGGFLNERQIEELLNDVNDDSESEAVERSPNINQLCDDEVISDRDSPEPITCSEDSVIEESSDSENERENTRNGNTRDEEEEYEDEEEESRDDDEGRTSHHYRGKNRYKWSKRAPSRSRTRRHNIITHLPGLAGPAREKRNMSELESWQLLVTDEMVEIIILHTNKKISEFRETHSSTGAHTNYIQKTEMNAFLGLTILAGVFKSGHEDLEGLWDSDGTGRDIFRATMSLKRYLFISSALRFDDVETRNERKANDRAALISEIFNMFINNCQKSYSCSEYITIDEMLCPFRGRCLFRVYMKSKPAKYGIKILCLCDSKTHYLYNAFIYTGKSESRRTDLSIPTRTVLDLVEPLKNSNRNITADNWFSSIELVDKLKEVGLTYVGTLRKNKREIPPEFLPHKTRPVGSSLFGFTNDKTLCSFVPKKSQSVIMISSMHHEESVDTESGKPEIIQFYNGTKGGVDSLDQKCANYSVARRTQRWPCVIFWAILNISSANGFVLWKASNPEKRMKRNKYLKKIGLDLATPFILQRKTGYANFSTDLKRRIDNILEQIHGQPENQSQSQEPVASTSSIASNSNRKRARCYLCDWKNDRKHSLKCTKCLHFICKTHSVQNIMCTSCQKV